MRALNIVPLSIMLVLGKERNVRAFEGVENVVPKLHNSHLFLVSFWCTHEVLCEQIIGFLFVENYIAV